MVKLIMGYTNIRTKNLYKIVFRSWHISDLTKKKFNIITERNIKRSKPL